MLDKLAKAILWVISIAALLLMVIVIIAALVAWPMYGVKAPTIGVLIALPVLWAFHRTLWR